MIASSRNTEYAAAAAATAAAQIPNCQPPSLWVNPFFRSYHLFCGNKIQPSIKYDVLLIKIRNVTFSGCAIRTCNAFCGHALRRASVPRVRYTEGPRCSDARVPSRKRGASCERQAGTRRACDARSNKNIRLPAVISCSPNLAQRQSCP